MSEAERHKTATDLPEIGRSVLGYYNSSAYTRGEGVGVRYCGENIWKSLILGKLVHAPDEWSYSRPVEPAAELVPSEIQAKIRLSNGSYFDLLNPQPESITIEVIAHALSNLCRYCGHSPQFYSVAEHSVHCCIEARRDGSQLVREVLLHDAAEAFVGDMVRQLKRLIPSYAALEHRVAAMIADKFSLRTDADAKAEIKRYDNIVLKAECRDFWGTDPEVQAWFAEIETRDIRIGCAPPGRAKAAFLIEAGELGLLKNDNTA